MAVRFGNPDACAQAARADQEIIEDLADEEIVLVGLNIIPV